MKRLSTIIMALALVLGMSQCKKQETPTNGDSGEKVHITLNVNNGESLAVNVDNGGRHAVAPNLGVIQFRDTDVLYVGNNGRYIGQLTYTNGAFGGELEAPTGDDYLHFYFLGGKVPATAPTAGTTTDFTIDIANQSQNLPVLCYGASSQKYTATATKYSAVLEYKCALVRFDLENHGEDYTVTLSGVPTQATVNFANPTATTAIVATANQTNANMTLYGEPGNAAYRWAILLKDTNLDDAEDLTIGSTVANHVMDNNTYINGGISVSNPLPGPAAPDAQYAVKKSNGDLSQFTVNENGKKVYFSKANLRFVGFNNNTGSWSFHENQVDASYASPGYSSSTESTNDRFAWGLYGNHGMYEDDWPAITTNLSKADGNDWGCAFSETSPEGTNWRTLTIDEWDYLFNGRSQEKRFLKVCLKLAESGEPFAVQGILLFPDDYVEPDDLAKDFTYNFNTSASTGSGYVIADGSTWPSASLYTDPTSNSYKMLAVGAVFLPAAGYRIQQWYQMYYCHTPAAYTSSTKRDAYGYYWSSTSGAYNEFSHTSRAFYFDRETVGEASSYQDRSHGMCVRLVWDAN